MLGLKRVTEPLTEIGGKIDYYAVDEKTAKQEPTLRQIRSSRRP